MKKILFGVAALGLLGLAGAGLGLKAQDTVEAKAAAGDESSWGITGKNGSLAENNWNPETRLRLTCTDNSVLHSWRSITFTGGEVFKVMDGSSWLGWADTFGPAKTNFSKDGDSDIKVDVAGSYDIAVIWNEAIGANRIGFYPSGTLSDNIENDSAIYICMLPNDDGYWVPTKIYSFGGSAQFGSFSTKTDMSDLPGYKVTSGINLAGAYGEVKKVPYSSVMLDDTFIIHNGLAEPYQSADTALNNGVAYYFNGKNGGGQATLASDADLGKAAEFILKAEAFRNAVAEDDVKGIFAKSICGIDPTNIATILADYAALTDEQKDYVNDTTVNTYVENASSEYDKETTGTVRYEDIIAELTELAKPKAGVMSVVGSSKDDSTLMIVAGITTVTVLAGASVLIARKRRAE